MAAEVKHWKSLIYLRLICVDRKRGLKVSRSPGASLPLCFIIWSDAADMFKRQEHCGMNWRDIYNYLLLQVRKIHPHKNIWHAKYKGHILNIDTVIDIEYIESIFA